MLRRINLGVKILVFLIALLMSFLVNELNVSYLTKVNPTNTTLNNSSLVHNSTIWSIDNLFYTSYAKNLKEGNGFTSDPNEPEMRVRRTPVYPLFYAAHYLVLGEVKAHQFIKYSQVVLFALSAVMLMMCVYNFTSNNRLAIVTGLLYAANIFVFSFNYYTITEAMSPFCVVLVIFLFSKYYSKKQYSWLVLTGIALAIAYLCRPTTGIILLGLLLFIAIESSWNFREMFKKSFILIISFCFAISPWVIRNYVVRGEIIHAEKYYHGATMYFGRAHITLREIVGVWTNPANMSTEVFSNGLIALEKKEDKTARNQWISNYLDRWPEFVFQSIERESFEADMMALSECFYEKEKLKEANSLITRSELLNQSCEDQVYASLMEKKRKLIADAPMRYYVFTPLKTMKELVFNSVLHHFQVVTSLYKTNNTLGLLLKSLVYLFNVILFGSLIYLIFDKRIKSSFKSLLIVPTIALMIALTAFLFRYVESRYLIPIYPLLTISLSVLLLNLYTMLNNYRRKLISSS